MRDFRFRAWNGRRWCYDDVVLGYDGRILELVDSFGLELRDSGDKYKIVFSTGLKDKNGKEMFCSDIAKDDYGTLYLIEWSDEEMCGFMLNPLTEPECEVEEYKLWREGYLEIIGNIHESPELLEGEKQSTP